MRFSGIADDPDPVALRCFVDLVEGVSFGSTCERCFASERVVDAHRLLDAGHLQGRFALTVGPARTGFDRPSAVSRWVGREPPGVRTSPAGMLGGPHLCSPNIV